MKVTYSFHTEVPIPADELKRLYDHIGWWPERTLEDIGHILQQSIALGAWHDNQLIGFVRALTDGRCRAYLEDVCVLQAFRKQGIGQELIQRVQQQLEGIDVVSLFCDERDTAFYSKNKFKPTSQRVMHWKAK